MPPSPGTKPARDQAGAVGDGTSSAGAPAGLESKRPPALRPASFLEERSSMRALTRLASSAAGILLAAAPAAAQIDARMLRQPDVSATQIAFVYAGDVWVVPKT